MQHKGRILFGKGFISIQEFMTKIRKNQDEQVEFVVPMFNKKLFGRFHHFDSDDDDVGYYANWDICLSWKDSLKGLIKNDLQTSTLIFGNEAFFVGI